MRKVAVKMNGRGSEAGNVSKVAQRGLWRLMLKLPALRGRLQIVAARNRRLDDLFEAYEEASLTLERLRKDDGGKESPLAREYEILCSDIEADAIQYILQNGTGVPD